MMQSGRAFARTSSSPNYSPFTILAAVLLAAAAAVFFYCAANAVQKPFTLDETDIALRAHLINHEGPFPKGFVTGGAEALTHPPLYEFVVALLFRLWGEKESTARIFGILNYLAVIWVSGWTLNFLTRTFRPAVQYGAFAVFLGVMLSNPLMIQHAMLLDADTTGTALCAAVFLCVFVRAEQARPVLFWVSRFALALVVAAMFLFKEAGPFLIFAGVGAYRLLNRDFKRLLIDLAVVLGLGALLAWIVWVSYTHALGMDPMRIYASQGGARYARMSAGGFLMKALKSLPVISRWPVYWNSAPLAALAALTLILRAGRFLRTKRLELVDAVWFCALAVWLPFLLVKPSIDMMKYQFPVYPLIFVAMICGAAQVLEERGAGSVWVRRAPRAWVPWVLWGGAGVLAITLFVHYRGMGDYLTLLFTKSERPIWRDFVLHYYAPLAAAALCGVAAGWMTRRFLAVCLSGLLLTAFPINTALNLSQVGDYTTAESWMNYGERGFKDAVQYLSGGLRPGSVTCLRKDMLYYLERRYGIAIARNLDPRDIFLTSKAQMGEFDVFLRTANMDFIVIDPISLLHLPQDRVDRVSAAISRHYALDRTFGYFKIYRKKSAGQVA